MTLVKFKNNNALGNFSSLTRPFSFPSFFPDALERLLTDEEVSWMPSVNIKERANDFKIDLAVPGMNKKDFKIEVEDGVLTVSGQRNEEIKEEDEKITRREFHYGVFKRSFTLPDSADSESVSASYQDGVLSLVVGKREEAKPKPKKQITVE